VTNRDCSDGFVCERSGIFCITTGCEPLTAVKRLFDAGGTGLEYDAVFHDGSIWAVVASSRGIGIAEISLDGRVISTVALESDPLFPADPVIVSSSLGVTAIWHGESGSNIQDIRVYHVADEDGSERGPRVVYQGIAGQNVDMLGAARVGDQIAVVWSTFVSRSQVQLLVLNLDGSFGDPPENVAPNHEAVLITDAATGSSFPRVMSAANRMALTRRETQSGSNTIEVSFFNDAFESVASTDISEPSTRVVDDLDADGYGDHIAATWLETRSSGRVLLRSVARQADGAIQTGIRTEDFTDNPTAMGIGGGDNEFAIVWVAEDQGRDLFMRRFDEEGEPLFVTFDITQGAADDPIRPSAIRTNDGYVVMWVEDASDPPDLMFRRYLCGR
jgi:hypothetical protein